MSEYLFRVSIVPGLFNRKKQKPVYAVAESPEKAREYVKQHIRGDYKLGKVCLCGKRLGMNLFNGK